MDIHQSVSGTQSTSTYSETSKSSSKSAASTEKERIMDLTKDNVASPIDLECHIQSERITKIIDEAIYKCKVAVCLPGLVQEYRTLDSILTPSHMEDLIFIFEQYDNPLFSASLLNVAVMEDLKAEDVSLKHRLNPELGHLLYILNSYSALKPYIIDMIAKIKENHNKESVPGFGFLLEMENFRELMLWQMQITAAEELNAKINTRKLEQSNARLIEQIKDLSRTLKEESDRFDKTMALKAEIITKLENELSVLSFDATVLLKKKILDSERQMVLATRTHVVTYEMLKEEEIETHDAYQQLLRQHLIDEKSQRARRFKVETQLLSWLQKYDLEMSEKQVELDEFTKNYEEELEKCEELEKQIAEQDIQYIPLMAEREEEYHQEMTEKMNKFAMEHAARVIQQAWREVLANRAEKKKQKGKAKKGKKKAEKIVEEKTD